MDAPFPVGMVADIAKFFSDVHPKLKPGQDVYPAVFATEHFFPLQRQREMARMLQIARKVGTEQCSSCKAGYCTWPSDLIGADKSECIECGGTGTVGGPKTVMEIGADKGGGIYHWCMSLPSVEHVIACEIRGTPYRKLFQTAFPRIEFTWLDGMSSYDPNTVGYVEARLSDPFPNTIDVLFVDGDKSMFKRDFDLYVRFMRPGGVVFVHDIQDSPGPKEAWQSIRQSGARYEEIIDIGDYRESAARGGEASCPHDGWLRHWKGRSCGVGVLYL